ncbi:hypothetical protein A8990_1048 [Paenibacillus taihuensis]|uniref:Uncharacterized protein n=1 Tax=Paenibacillus taihuensis TaxID=1156355 RepID=A0A3D9SC94_9BACL|nr:hypothetical protein A8990_1048 [Paenibacillus taihuensis]
MDKLLVKSLFDEITKSLKVAKKRCVDIYYLNKVWYRKDLAVDEIHELTCMSKLSL